MNNLRRRSILVTGGFGFIGTHLVELLLEDGRNHVHVVDNLSTSRVDVGAFIAQLRSPERVTYDICSVQEFLARSDVPRFDEIYHLAAIVGPVGVLQHAGEILRQTSIDTYLIADAAQRTGARICNISTSEVYGGGRDGYCSEADSMIIPPKISARLEYAVAKLAAEIALINKSRAGLIHCTIVRPFNVAGPRQSTMGGFVLPRFIEQALVNDPITVYGDGTMVRAFTHVRDIADGIVLTMRRGENGEAYNIGNPANKIDIRQLAERVIEVLGSRSAITLVDPKKLWGPNFEEANDKYPDADRAMKQLGWAPKCDIDDIIAQAAKYTSDRRND